MSDDKPSDEGRPKPIQPIKRIQPKQIAGAALTRQKPKQVAGSGVTRQQPIPQKKPYGKRYKIIWRDKLLIPGIEIVKIMKSDGWSVELIDSEGNYRKNVSKMDLVLLALIDDDDKEIPLADLEPTPLDDLYDREGFNYRVLWKDDLMNPKVEVVTIVAETSHNCELVDSAGERKKNVTKGDLYFLEFLGEGKAANRPEEEPEPESEEAELKDEFPVGTKVSVVAGPACGQDGKIVPIGASTELPGYKKVILDSGSLCQIPVVDLEEIDEFPVGSPVRIKEGVNAAKKGVVVEPTELVPQTQRRVHLQDGTYFWIDKMNLELDNKDSDIDIR